MEPTLQTVALSVAAALYASGLTPLFPTAITRIAVSLPAFAAFLIAPLIYRASEYHSASMVTAAVVSWWANSKLLGLCMGRGPLAALESALHARRHPIARAAEFVIICLLPIVHDERAVSSSKPHSDSDSANSAIANAARAVLKLAVVLLCSWLIVVQHTSQPVVRHVIFSIIVYASASLIMDAPAAVCALLMPDIRLREHFRSPFLSISLREFWSRRWNITAGSILRECMYEPIVDAARGRRVSLLPADRLARATAADSRESTRQVPAYAMIAGVLGSFFVSGVAHEFVFRIPTGFDKNTYQWFCFFIVHAVAVIAEACVLDGRAHAAACEASALRRWTSRFITLVVVLASAEWLFWPCTEETGVADMLLREWTTLIPQRWM